MTTSPVSAEQVPSLPKGGGAVAPLGETFRPDPHTGTGAYAIPLEIPNGPDNIAPRLVLSYHTGAGQSPFGMGFDIPLPAISRSTAKGLPRYDDSDLLVLESVGDLVATGPGKYQLRYDPHAWLIERHGKGFRLVDRDGRDYYLGVTDATRVYDPDNPNRVFSWSLERIEDPLGNSVTFTYLRDGGRLYLSEVKYGIYTVHLTYKAGRPDPITNARSGFLVTTQLRCDVAELWTTTSPAYPIRRWEFQYDAAATGHSLLASVCLTGFAEDGTTAQAPRLSLGYTGFNPRKLARFRGLNAGATPGELSGGLRELTDWDGDGLPDLVDVSSGHGQVWSNLGDCVWSAPKLLDGMPAPLSFDDPTVALIDMEGNGTADLVVAGAPLAGYYPHRPDGSFGPPVYWQQAPSTAFGDPEMRLVDLDADGIADMLVSGPHGFLLYFRDPAGGWRPKVQTVPAHAAPPVSFSDPRVHLADMNGDGLVDVVRVEGGAVAYWPYLGNGRWAASVRLNGPPAQKPDYDPARFFLADIDGDGCADLVYAGFDAVTYWLNESGARFSAPHEIRHVPPIHTGSLRLADMRGSGTAGLLWSCTIPATGKLEHFYLDFTDRAKPYLLSKIDNGIGLVTEIGYLTSTGEAARDRAAGARWPTFLPFPVAVVSVVRATDAVTGQVSWTRFRYHNGHYDGNRREFAGFGKVETEEKGDDAMPGLLTVSTFHQGVPPDDPLAQLPAAEAARWRALRGRLLKTEIYGLDKAPEAVYPYTVLENDWAWQVEGTGSAGEELLSVHLDESRGHHHERLPQPYRVNRDRCSRYDPYGNLAEHVQTAIFPADPLTAQVLRIATTPALHPDHKFRNRRARTTEYDRTGHLIAATILYYDGLPEGQVGDRGLVTRQETLVMTDAMVAAVYGAAVPDFAALGYHRRPGEDGWWIDQGAWTRTDGPDGREGTATNAKGHTVRLTYDAYGIHPACSVDPLDNTVQASYDYRSNKATSFTGANGVTLHNRYDALGRLNRYIEPGADDLFPTARYVYDSLNVPASMTVEGRLVNGKPGVLARRTFYDGHGAAIEQRVAGGKDQTVEYSELRCARGQVRARWLPHTPAGRAYTAPDPASPHVEFRYDALGRLLETVAPDGSVRRQKYEPRMAYLYDAEDSLVAGPHWDTPARHTFDAAGRVSEVAALCDGRWISTQYAYDPKGQLTAVTDALGARTELAYDLLGRRLATSAPACGRTVYVYDPNGNLIERRDANDQVTKWSFDELDRRSSVDFPAAGLLSTITFHDTDRPASGADALALGRVARADSAAGQETYTYDELGRVVTKRVQPAGLPGQKLRFDYEYRADGRLRSITYPEPAPGAGRRILSFEYDARGRLRRIPGILNECKYDAAGQRRLTEYANGVTASYTYDQLTRRPSSLKISGSGGALVHLGYRYDLVGNLLHVSNLLEVKSPDPSDTALYTYDDLYRLRTASTTGAAGEPLAWTYDYDDLGNLKYKSDVGTYVYDTLGRMASAGPQTFDYTAGGQVASASGPTPGAPPVTYTYDELGRLKQIDRGAESMRCTVDYNGRRVGTELVGVAGGPAVRLTPDDSLSIEDGVFYALVFDGSTPVARIRLNTQEVAFLHADHLGSTILVTDHNGSAVTRVRYDPFGALQQDPTPAVAGTLLYTGQVWDAWSGLHYCRARYYDPHLGRFLAPDPMVPEAYNTQAWCRYSYAANNPMRFVDPTGLFFLTDWLESAWEWAKDNVGTIILVAAVAAATVLSGGAAGVMTGVLVGGFMGGYSAYRAGGNVFLGVLVGAAVGGAAAYVGGAIPGSGFVTGLSAGNALAAAALTGALQGAVNGAAVGLTVSFAGGQGDIGDMLKGTFGGAAVGFITGGLVGGGKAALQQGWNSVKGLDLWNAFGGGGSSAFRWLENLTCVDNPLLKNMGAEIGKAFATSVVSGEKIDDTGLAMAGMMGGFNGGVEWLNVDSLKGINDLSNKLYSATNATKDLSSPIAMPKLILDYSDWVGGARDALNKPPHPAPAVAQ